ncbi:probable Gem-associated protein 2 [Coccomyxa sp. Obi]|nr:probable Gem-associated protein 2 [Coccomyxa sp. Obi]
MQTAGLDDTPAAAAQPDQPFPVQPNRMSGVSENDVQEEGPRDAELAEEGSDAFEEYDKFDDEEESFDRQAYGLYQQLPIRKGLPDYSTGPPQTAEEYLRRVRHEASQLPDIVISDIDAREFDDKRTAYVVADATPSGHHEMEEQWLESFLIDFAQLRLNLQHSAEVAGSEGSQHPTTDDINEWHAYCFGEESGVIDEDEDSGHVPNMGVVQSLNQLTVNRLLKWHITWQCEAPAIQDRSVQWIYALTSVLEKPLAMGTAAALRDLLRYCARQQPVSAEDAARKAVLVAIAGAYFGQDEHLAVLPAVQALRAKS